MSIFTRIIQRALGSVAPSPTDAESREVISRKRKRDTSNDNEDTGPILKYGDGEAPVVDSDDNITKRLRTGRNLFAPIVHGKIYESTSISGPSGMHDCHHANIAPEADCILMPPPLNTASSRRMPAYHFQTTQESASADFDASSQFSAGTTTNLQKTSADILEEDDMERARRHAAATNLPLNSGVWERGEEELFFHLSYRGFEPLLPKNWMTDFRTLPLTLYSPDTEDASEPLIKARKPHGEFRAIRELRDLLDLGKDVRDKVLISPGVKVETIVERATKRYIAWALADAGIKLSIPASRRGPLPIHVIVKLKSNQTTTSCLLELKEKLHALRTRHYRVRNIHESIERDTSDLMTPESGSPTKVAETSKDDIPVLYGILICKSILAIFTLNSRTPPMKNTAFPAWGRNHYRPSPAITESTTATKLDTQHLPSMEVDEENEDDSTSDPRFIADFDFSDSTKDVWNALVIAIVAMQIRKDMLLPEGTGGVDESIEDIRAGIEDNSIMDEDERLDA
ncbi:hypothetical protein LTR51_000809 [Lithohypha guttulata]|nr:hypothetical protein LTR51_000809 [Lithohypha guttulata]